MFLSFRKSLLAGCALLVALHPLRAQDLVRSPDSSTSPASTTVERIVITGEALDENVYYTPDAAGAAKTDTPLLETPQSVTVINQAQIQAQQAQSLNQTLRYAPGVQSEQYGLENLYDFFQIRGFSANANGVFRDGLQLNSGVGFASFRLEPYGAERIEVIRGPDSVLYGQTNPGGIVNYVSKLPLSERHQEVEFNAGSLHLANFVCQKTSAIFSFAASMNGHQTHLRFSRRWHQRHHGSFGAGGHWPREPQRSEVPH